VRRRGTWRLCCKPLGRTSLKRNFGTERFGLGCAIMKRFFFDLVGEVRARSQAIGKAGGLSDVQSDPGEIYVYRFEDRHFLEKLGVDTRRFILDKIPTIYRINLRDPSGLLLSSAFQMRTKDVLYIANAKVVDYYKLLTLINNTTTTVRNVNSGVHEIAAPLN
jgi:polysaccharide biosynthesis/export protein